MSISKSPESLIRHLSAQSGDPEEALRLLLAGLRPELGCHWIGIFVGGAPAQDTQFQRLAEAGDDPGYPAVGPSADEVHRDLFSLAGPYERIRQDVNAVEKPAPVERVLMMARMRAYAVLPLVSGGQVVGSLQALSRTPQHFDMKRMARLRTNANQLAVVALHVLYMRRHIRQTQLLSLTQELIEELGSVPDIRGTCEHVARRLLDIMQADRVSMYLTDPEREFLTCEASFEGGRKAGEGSRLLPSLRMQLTPFGGSAISGLPLLLTPGDRHRLNAEVAGLIRLEETETLLAIPLMQGERSLGFVLCQKGTPGGTLFEDDLSSLRVLGQQLGLIVYSRRAVEHQERSLRNFAGLLGISHAMASTTDLGQIPELIARKAQDLTEADTCTLFLLNEPASTLEPAVCLGTYREQILHMRVRVGEGITGTAAATRRGEIVNRADEDVRTLDVPETPREKEAILTAPLVSGDRLLGVLTLHKFKGRTFEQVDLDTVEIFAGQGAVALENARLFAGLQAERNRLATMIQQMREAVIFAGTDGNIVLINEAARITLGLGSRDVTGHPLLELLGRADLGAIREALLRLRKGTEPSLTIEHMLEGQTYVCSISAVNGTAGEPRAGEVVLLQNVTELKEIEAQLAQSSKMSAVGQLAAGVAHEFNNLIAGIYGYAQLMRENQDPATVKKGIDVIFRSSERARELTSSLLTFSRRRPGRRESVDLNQILGDTLLLLNRQMEKSRIQVVRRLEPLPTTVADAGKLQQVFLNILINAQQAMETGGTLTVASRMAGEMVEFTFQDTGHGIREEHLPRIFEPFFTTKGPLAGAKVPGTGLGLSSAYNIVRDHGGNITVTSRPGEGATFVVSIQATAVRPVSEARPLATVSTPSPVEPGGRILIVEDDPTLRQLMSEVLREQGYRVEEGTTQKDVMGLLHDPIPDLLILDQTVPGEDTRATLEVVRRAQPRLPVILVAGRSPSARIDSDGDPWLFRINKPFRNRDLLALVSRILTLVLRQAS